MQAWYAQYIDGSALAIASVIVLCGVGVLFFAWRRRERHAGLLALGWGLIALSYRFWSQAGGADSGATIGTVLLMLAAIVLVLVNGDWANGDSRAKERRAASRNGGGAKSALDDAPTADPHRARRTVLRTLAAGPLAFGAALALSMLVVVFARWPEADRIVLGACVLLLVWPAAMVWSCATARIRAPILTLATVTILSAAMLPFAT